MPIQRVTAATVVQDANAYTGETAKMWAGYVRVPDYVIFVPADGGAPVSVKGGAPGSPPKRAAPKADPAPGPGKKGGENPKNPKEG